MGISYIPSKKKNIPVADSFFQSHSTPSQHINDVKSQILAGAVSCPVCLTEQSNKVLLTPCAHPLCVTCAVPCVERG